MGEKCVVVNPGKCGGRVGRAEVGAVEVVEWKEEKERTGREGSIYGPKQRELGEPASVCSHMIFGQTFQTLV